jgi:WS/DGAT/MGAT family acyltransferase
MACAFPGDPSAELNLIPVDWVVRGIIAAVKRPQAVGERVHLATDKRLTSEQIRDTVFEELGVEVRLAEPTLHRNVTLPVMTRLLKGAGQGKVAGGLEKLGTIFGGYSEWGQPIHEVGNDHKILGLPDDRPDTQQAFRMLCRHNRWVQHFARLRDPDELSRREQGWQETIEQIEEHTGQPAGALTADEFRLAMLARIDVETFVPLGSGNGHHPVVRNHAQEALGPVDHAWLQMDRDENRMIITAMVFFDEELDLAEFKEIVTERLLRYERFTQRVVAPERGRSLPVWETDPDFDLDNHLVGETLDGDGSDAALNALVDQLASQGLDPDRPPWQFHVVQGWKGGGALVVRLHHCIGDGAALVYVMLSMTDAVHEQAQLDALTHFQVTHPEPPGAIARLAGLIKKSGVALHDRIETFADPRNTFNMAKLGLSGVAALGKLVLMSPDPKSSLRGPLAPEKRTAWSSPISLGQIKAIRRSLDATVNDILMAALSGALRTYLEGRGDVPEELGALRAIVPVNLRPPDQDPEFGNRFGLVFLPLPVGRPHELGRLEEIRRAMNAIKSSPEALISLKALDGLGRLTQAMEDRALDVFTAKASLVASNVPGPYERLFLKGKAVRSCIFWVPQSGTLGLGISILSYAGEIRVGVLADAGLIPDPKAIIEAFEEEIASLGRSLGHDTSDDGETDVA